MNCWTSLSVSQRNEEEGEYIWLWFQLIRVTFQELRPSLNSNLNITRITSDSSEVADEEAAAAAVSAPATEGADDAKDTITVWNGRRL